MESLKCKIYPNCLDCKATGNDIFYQLKLNKGDRIQQYIHKQNELLLILSGQALISSLRLPDISISEGQILSLPEGVEMDIAILEDVDCLVYVLNEKNLLCEEQYRIITEPPPNNLSWHTLGILPPLKSFIDTVIMNLENGLQCRSFWTIKEQELMLLVNLYYPRQELVEFITPTIYRMNRFRMFVQNNYYKVKSVEELALLGGYGTVTFRRLFKEEYGEPAYRWMNKQKKEHILYDLKYRNLSISEISYKYQFESLSQFSNFCKKYLGKAPRDIVRERSNR